MKRILFLSTLESVPWGGSEQLWSDMAIRLLENGYKVMTCTMEWPEPHKKIKEIQSNGGKTVFRPNPHIKSSLSTSAANKIKALKWRTEVLEFAPDVLLINQGGTFDNATALLGEWILSLGIPFFILPNFCPEYGYLETDKRHLFSAFFRKARQLWFVSRRNMEVAERTLAQDIPNGIVIKNPIRLKDVPTIFPANDVYQMATVARLETEVKGYDILMETFAQPQWRERDYRVNIYGMGDHMEYLKDYAKYRSIDDKVIFKGFNNNIVSVWEENHIMLMPSRGEGTPLSLLEAGFCSRAAVVTDVGGNADVVRHGYNGFVADAPVIKSFTETMEVAWEKRGQWEEMGRNARRNLDENWPADAVAEVIKLMGL